MKNKVLSLTSLLFLILAVSALSPQTVYAQHTSDGKACPMVGPVNITSPTNATYASDIIILSFSIYGLFDNTIYDYQLSYSIDHQENMTIPSSKLVFTLPNGDTGAFTVIKCSGAVTLPQLDEGNHQLDVYATYERISLNHNYPAFIYSNSTVDFIINKGIPPIISYLSITNQTYERSNLMLNCTIDKKASWVGYTLDGKENVTITNNTVLSNLTDGQHNLIVYANDTLGNMGASQTINFTVKPPPSKTIENSMAVSIIAVPVAIVFMVLVLVLLRKHRKTALVKNL